MLHRMRSRLAQQRTALIDRARATRLVVANARRSPSYGCALRLDWSALGSPLGHAELPLTL